MNFPFSCYNISSIFISASCAPPQKIRNLQAIPQKCYIICMGNFYCCSTESNILYLLTCRCGDIRRCGNIWRCGCLKSEKYEVKLSDLDSVSEVEHSEDPRLLPNISCRAKTNEEWKCDTGTPGCHAPEVTVV